jgi:hypothetical protein
LVFVFVITLLSSLHDDGYDCNDAASNAFDGIANSLCDISNDINDINDIGIEHVPGNKHTAKNALVVVGLNDMKSHFFMILLYCIILLNFLFLLC